MEMIAQLQMEVKCRIARNLVVPTSVSGHIWPGRCPASKLVPVTLPAGSG